MIVVLALMLGPLALPAGQAVAAPPTSHHGDVTAIDHCDEEQQQEHRRNKADEGCCVAGCMAVAALHAPPAEPTAMPASRERPAPDRFRLGYLGEIATPPPRTA